MKKSNTQKRLKELMDKRNYKQRDILELITPICDKCSVKFNKSDLSQYVSGKTEPNQDKLFVLSVALGVCPSWLMGFDVEENCEKSLTLTAEERQLIGNYRELNDDGKLQLENSMENLLCNPKLKKRDNDLSKQA